MTRPAVVLLSGGLDSATVLAMARADGYDCHALSINYGQRHGAELIAAARVAVAGGALSQRTVSVNLDAIGGSALTDSSIAVPSAPSAGIPITYVPARNTVFLAIALGYAEVLAAQAIFVGVNAVDYSGYPDCRPAYIDAFRALAAVATRAGVEGHAPRIEAPLLHLSKADIIRRGLELDVDYGLTVSCYNADPLGRACGQCDACHLRAQGFSAAGVPDPTVYFFA
ncbi:MAG: 7-cyano-7-deazaguanine synthase QueC [Immundisolibacter sp.]|uniref:7-cyano-7-deazaguanine synthase QueC n=1 Tax=Immundisolibacter sp. TaxID=1934948 RepID=UPI003EE0CE96